MNNTCHFCGAELTETNHCNKKRENENLDLNGGAPIVFCKLCKDNQEEKFIKRDAFGPDAASLIIPTVSLSSSESFASSCSDYSVDVNSYFRSNQEEGTIDSTHGDFNSSLNGHLQNSSSTTAKGSDRSSTMMERKEDIDGDLAYASRDVGSISINGGHEERAGFLEFDGGLYNVETQGGDASHSLDDEFAAQIWEPPEPEDFDDDMEGSVANFDDDDDCGDGTEWGKPILLSRFGEEGSRSHSFKEEKQRAMEEVMNGKFKALVGQLLKSVGVSLSGEDRESWIDVVTSLTWEAASFVKLDAGESKAMDPDGYVKVKCIASGSRSQSQVIKGLVFKKHAAHKHMPTKCKNPRLLLIRGMLGQSSSGLSSFDLMDEERNNLNSVIEMIEISHPNVVLVERSVSRDVQEFMFKKGTTLVYDMKLHRLERVARCTGSPILSSGTLAGQKLKQCDDFHFEKFIEEHAASVEGGKRPSKTLMFIEGCPTRHGCTILLKGSHSDQLKKIKCVVQCAFVMAHHLILETSFLADRRAMFCTVPFVGMQSILPNGHQSSFVGPVTSTVSCLEACTSKHVLSRSTCDIPISGSENLSLGVEANSVLFCEPYNPDAFSGLSSLQASLKKVIGDSFPRSSTPYQSLSSYLGLNGREQDGHISSSLPLLTPPETLSHDLEEKCKLGEEKPTDSEKVPPSFLVRGGAPQHTRKFGACNEDPMQSKDDIGMVLDSQSILVLMSSRNASKGTICEQIHFSHIQFYKNFDVPLGKFLRDNLLNERHQCMTCGEPPEAHFYYYAHQKKQLTIHVKRLLLEKRLPGVAEGKLWMWSRCGKCKPGNGSTKSTKRVLISTATRGLSFGKFLEMSFSPGSPFKESSCGHSLDSDFLYFFGLGLMVAMFRYSPVVTYAVSVPPQKLELSNSTTRSGWLDKEIEHVHKRGMFMFMEVESALQKIGSCLGGSTLNFEGSKFFTDIEEMLRRERSEFEVNIQIVKNGSSNKVLNKILSLNRMLWELLLESCVWDRRVQLLSSDSKMVDTTSSDTARQGQENLKEDDVANQATDKMVNSHEILDDSAEVKVKLEKLLAESEFSLKEIPVEGPFQGSGGHDDLLSISTKVQGIESPDLGSLSPTGAEDKSILVRHRVFANSQSGAGNCTGENFPLSGHIEADRLPVFAFPGNSSSSNSLNSSQRGNFLSLLLSDTENWKEYVWTPFPEIRRDCTKDIQKGLMPKFEPIRSHNKEFLPSIHQLISEEGSRLHIFLNSDDFMVLDFEDELSSIIACALALLRNSPVLTEDLDGDSVKEKGMTFKTAESSLEISRIASMTSSHSSTGSLDSDGTHSRPNVSLEESRFSSFDGFNLLNSLVSFGALHPEVPLGVGKLPGKVKYSVVCLYCSQFRDLRNRCCPSELEYIASLSRCRNWDAKGGKSKSFFAKTLDDRFIIKEIKKTEFDSFMKFALDYFGYMNHSFDSGSQTCLTKILGIYQVRLMKSGKEVKHDLMIMENLTFGRNVTRQYDLKGALHARFNSAADGSGDVLLDQNFVNDMNASPLYVSNKAKRLLQRAVWNDTKFLNSINVMDYSLLMGVDGQRRELVCGIIDYLRQYTLDKQVETWVKSSLVVPKHLLPTVISPVEYKKRFRKFMSTHFLCVPDHWCSEQSSDPCELCGAESG